ncbi:hypothetical protein D8X55_03375 [Malacoplasma penetrans]|uniref:Uncharacterized protein n=1 Tax=Malacoplasma penetrans (strain HF-2) TaxID=272633 RepID=Q8EV42_MALP2|nr:hypothetical protein [Malacoplasma penetrans]RXY96573.1 hypothetical protein D8X55_03375 [Malacoplasma penetrans]BAC44519.1 conserved hypothetical protein [Malacoplasma penetrans HF-2]
MKLKNKKLILLPIALVPAAVALAAIPTSLVSTKNSSSGEVKNSPLTETTNKGIYFDNAYYSSLDEATNSVLLKNQNINEKFLIGDLADSIQDTSTKILNTEKLKTYDVSKLSKAYKTANGSYTDNYDDAKNSFVNNGLISEAYDDLNGNIFYSESEARESLRKQTVGIPTPYYLVTDENGYDVKLNPLNKDDINRFKKIAIRSLKGQKSNNNFKMELYVKDDNGNLVKYNDKNSNVFRSKEEFLNKKKQIDDSLREAFNEEFKNILSKIKINFNVGFKHFPEKNWRWDWTFIENYRPGKTININKTKDNKDLTLLDLLQSREGQANTIYTFLDPNVLSRSGRHSVRRSPLGYEFASEYFDINVYGSKFDIWNIGNNTIDRAPGIDFELLKKGNTGLYMGYDIGSTRFDISLTTGLNLRNEVEKYLSDNNNLSTLKQKFESKLKEKDGGEIDQKLLDKIELKDLNQIFTDFIKTKKNQWDASYKTFNADYTYTADRNANNVAVELQKQKQQLNNFKSSLDFSSDSINSYDVLIHKLYGVQETSDSNFKYDKEKVELIISYNDSPVFSLKDQVELKENGITNLKDLFDENLDNLVNKLDNEDIAVEAWQNISSKVVKKQVDGKQVLEYTNKNNNSNNLIFSSLNKKNGGITYITKDDVLNLYSLFNTTRDQFKRNLETQSNLTKISENAKLSSSYGIALGLYSYAKRLEEIGINEIRLNPSKYKDLISNFNDDVLVLAKSSNNWNTMYYAEYLGGKNSINSALSKNYVSIYETYKEKSNALNQNNYLRPAKIILIYDLNGKIVNIDTIVTDNSNYADGSYDDRQTVINNALNTIIVNQGKDLVFYSDKSNKILIKNEVNQVYELSIDNRTYYFLTFDDAKNYLKNHIKNFAVYS